MPVSNLETSPVPLEDLVQEPDRILAPAARLGLSFASVAGWRSVSAVVGVARASMSRVDLVVRDASQDALTRTTRPLGYLTRRAIQLASREERALLRQSLQPASR
jgi:hypothetical protein